MRAEATISAWRRSYKADLEITNLTAASATAWYLCDIFCKDPHGHDEGSVNQEVRRRDSDPRSRVEARAPEGDQTRARVGRLARKRGISRGQRAPATRRIAHQHAAEARVGNRSDQCRSHSEQSRRIRFDTPRRGEQWREDDLSARHAGRCRCGQGIDLDDVADWTRVPQ